MTSAPQNLSDDRIRPPELELNLRPGVQMSPPRATARSPPGLSGHSPGNSMVGSPPPSARPGLDELADSFAASFNVTNNPNDTNRPHPRFAQYKMKTSSISQVKSLWFNYRASEKDLILQEVRRKKLLEHQKARRDDLKNFARCLAAGDFDEEKEEEDEEEDMDTSGEVKSMQLPASSL